MFQYGIMKNHIGGTIRLLRMKKKWNQETLAKELLIPRSSVSKIENGKMNINTFLISKLTRVFKISANKLLSD